MRFEHHSLGGSLMPGFTWIGPDLGKTMGEKLAVENRDFLVGS